MSRHKRKTHVDISVNDDDANNYKELTLNSALNWQSIVSVCWKGSYCEICLNVLFQKALSRSTWFVVSFCSFQC